MKTLKAYKVFDENWKCRGFQYKIGESYSISGQSVLCERGFHACKKVQDCFSYYEFNPKNKVAEVVLSGIIIGVEGDKQCATEIKILKEISWESMLVLANSGSGNSGHRNSGDSNSGHSNSGHWNSGHWNSGHFNSKTPDTILVFNKPCKVDLWDSVRKPNFIYNIVINQWVSWSNMSDDEKKENKDAFVTDGYLKRFDYKEAWNEAYKSATKEDIELLKGLPNFSKKVFEEISSIKIK
jgi:hypothetical protein